MPTSLFVVLLLLAFDPRLEQPGSVPRLAVLLVGAPLLVAYALRIRNKLAHAPMLPFGGAVLAIGSIGLFLSPAAERAVVAVDLLSVLILFLIAIGGTASSDESIARGVAWGLCILAPIGLLQAWCGFDWIPQGRPPASLFVNRNVCAEALVVAVPLAWRYGTGAKESLSRWLGFMAAGLGAALLIATRARGAWIAAALGWGLMLLLRRRAPRQEERRPMALAALAILAAIFLPVVGAEPLPSVGSTLGSWRDLKSGSGEVRIALWKNSTAMIAERPWFGAGAGRFSALYPAYAHRVVSDPNYGEERQAEHAENDSLEFAVDFGLAGAAAIVGFLLFATWKKRGDPSLIAALLLSCVAFPLHSPASSGLTFLIAGTAWRDRAAASDRARRFVLPAMFLLAAVGATICFGSWRAQAALGAAFRPEMHCDRAIETAQLQPPWARRDFGLATALLFSCANTDPRTLPILERALARQPHQLNLLLQVSAARLSSGDALGAEAAARHSIELLPSSGRAWLLLAMSQATRGDLSGAHDSCREALSKYRDGKEAQQFCSQLPAAVP